MPSEIPLPEKISPTKAKSLLGEYGLAKPGYLKAFLKFTEAFVDYERDRRNAASYPEPAYIPKSARRISISSHPKQPDPELEIQFAKAGVELALLYKDDAHKLPVGWRCFLQLAFLIAKQKCDITEDGFGDAAKVVENLQIPPSLQG